jgi:hypothetical protein
MIEGMVRMMNNPEGFIGPVNLGNPSEFTILELAEKVIRLTGSSSRIIHQGLPADDPTQRRPDISLAQERLGWQPRVQLEDGLVRTVGYFKRLINDLSLPAEAFEEERSIPPLGDSETPSSRRSPAPRPVPASAEDRWMRRQTTCQFRSGAPSIWHG